MKTSTRKPKCLTKPHASYRFFFLFLLFFSFCANAQVTIDTLAGKVNGVWWTNNNILNDPNAFSLEELAGAGTTPAQIKGAYPPTVGVFATVTWRSLAPDTTNFDWVNLDATLKIYSDSNLLIMLMVWAGPDCPNWMYDYVPTVFTDDPVRNKYPFYFYTTPSGDPFYKRHWYKMLDAVAAHVKAYTGKFRKSIVIVQSAEGRTGDEGPYKGTYAPGTPNAYKISRSSPEWIAFRQDAWKQLDALYRIGIPIPPAGNYQKQIHVLVNCDPDDPEAAGGWLQTNVPSAWRKTNTVGHGYQFNDEVQKKELFRPLIDSVYKPLPSADSVTYSRCRDEMDQYNNPWQSIAPRQYNFYQAASALYFGLDMWPNTATGLLDTARYKKGFDFFTRYAGYKTPQTSPGGFCVLHTGLDASDTVKFSTTLYGSGTEDADDFAGMSRCRKIAALGPTSANGLTTTGYYASAGAKQDDSLNAQGAAVNQLQAKGLNDVGWHIFTGNYERYLKQIIHPSDVSKNGWPYWRIGLNDTSNWYGRFCTGFRNGSNRDSLFFRIDDSLFTGTRPVTCTLRVVYYDTSTTPNGSTYSWKIYYDAQTNNVQPVNAKLLTSVRNLATSKWKEILIPITDGWFRHRSSQGADIIIANAHYANEMFALVEILKSQ